MKLFSDGLLNKILARVPNRGSTSLLAVALATLIGVTACMNTEEAVLIENPPLDSITFWPQTIKYARRGDTIYILANGIKRQRVCAIPSISWNWRQDTTKHQFYRMRSQFEIPAGSNCPADPEGLDTLFRRIPTPLVGHNLYLETPDGLITDSILYISEDNRTSEDGRTLVNAITLKYVAGGVDTLVSSRFFFTDSSLAHPRRMLRTDSLGTCEVFQAAVYEKRGDTTVVKARLIHGAPRPASVFPPCAGPRADSIEVVFNRFNFLP